METNKKPAHEFLMLIEHALGHSLNRHWQV